MQKIFKISSFLFLLTPVIFMSSCNKQDAALNTPNTVSATASTDFKLSNVKFENGMLIFNTRADFETAALLVQKGQQTVSDWLYNQFPNFYSQVKALKSLTQQDTLDILSSTEVPNKFSGFARKDRNEGENYVARVIETNILGNLVNKDGFIGYADSVFKITYNNVYGISKSDFSKSTGNKLIMNSSNAKVVVINHNTIFAKEKKDVSFRFNLDYFTEYLYSGVKRWSGIVYTSGTPLGAYVEFTTRYEGHWLDWYKPWSTDQAQIMGVGGVFKTDELIDPNDPNPNFGSYQSFGIPYVTQRDVGILAASAVAFSGSGRQSNNVIAWSTVHYCYDYNGNAHNGTLTHNY